MSIEQMNDCKQAVIKMFKHRTEQQQQTLVSCNMTVNPCSQLGNMIHIVMDFYTASANLYFLNYYCVIIVAHLHRNKQLIKFKST